MNMNKYQLNQLLTYLFGFAFVGVFIFLCLTPTLSLWQSALVMALLVFLEHYILNLVHIASHRSISKNAFYNDLLGNFLSIISGVTLPVFRATHNLHHAYPNNPEKDPDFVISTKGALWWLPARIFYHDYAFFKRGLYKQKNALFTYFTDRLIQIALVLLFLFTGKLDIWIFYWLPSILIIGFFYGLFQFYFPHYSTKTIDSWRLLAHKNIFQKLFIFWVDFCMYYHYKHHEKINSNRPYFPFWSYFQDRCVLKKDLVELLKEVKY
jgi:beta-carotene hydroxylase